MIEKAPFTARGPSDVASNQDHLYPVWEPTDWTPRQRATAIGALLLLTLACGSLCGVLLVWGTGSQARHSVVPLGMSLLCLVAAVLSTVFWYAYAHAHNSVSANHGNSGIVAYGALALTELATLVTLIQQIVALTLGARVGWFGQQGYMLFIFIAAMGFCFLMAFGLSVMAPVLLWRPTRDPTSPRSALGAPVTGVRLIVRWLVMLVARNGWLLIGPPLWAFVGSDHQTPPTPGSSVILPAPPPSPAPVSAWAIVAGIAGVFFLIAALSELTHRA